MLSRSVCLTRFAFDWPRACAVPPTRAIRYKIGQYYRPHEDYFADEVWLIFEPCLNATIASNSFNRRWDACR